MYTGHSLRVSSATALADEGASTLTLKRHGRRRSEAIAESYVRESHHVLKETAATFAGSGTAVMHEQEELHKQPMSVIVLIIVFLTAMLS